MELDLRSVSKGVKKMLILLKGQHFCFQDRVKLREHRHKPSTLED